MNKSCGFWQPLVSLNWIERPVTRCALSLIIIFLIINTHIPIKITFAAALNLSEKKKNPPPPTPNHFCHKGCDDWKYKLHQRANEVLREHTQHTARASPAAATYSVSCNHSTKGMCGKYSDMSVTQSDRVPQLLLSKVLFIEQLWEESLPCFACSKFNFLQSHQMSD